MGVCATYKIIPKEELDRVFETSDSASGDMDFEFLCFEEVYMYVKEHCNKDTVIIDFGCAYMPQAYWFTDCKKYIGIDLPFRNNVRFKTDNSELYLMSGQKFIKNILPTLDLDMEKVIAICSYVPDEELEQMVAEHFKYNYVQYCSHIISDKLPTKEVRHDRTRSNKKIEYVGRSIKFSKT